MSAQGKLCACNDRFFTDGSIGNVQESFVFLFSSNTAIPQETATIQAKLDSMYFSAITTNKSNREITLDLLQALEGLVGVVTVTLFEDVSTPHHNTVI